MPPAPPPSLTMRVTTRLRFLLLDHDFEFTELLIGLAATTWGLWVATPFWRTFDGISYSALAYVAPEVVWGVGALALGILQLWALLHEWARWRKRLAFVSVILWLFIAASFAFADLSSAGVAIYPLFVLSAVWVYLRLHLIYRPGP